jgi:hypothetical protein
MDTRFLSIIGLLLVIFIGAMLGNNGVVGYSSVKTLNEYPYEGFDQIQSNYEARDKKHAEAFEPMDGKKKYAEAFEPMDEKKKYAEAFEAMDSKKKYAEAFEPMDSPAIKVAGFSGLQVGAYGDEKIIGFMYNNESNTSCKPFGYTNSKGNICMSNQDIKMLTSRGGNALGVSDQIGN